MTQETGVGALPWNGALPTAQTSVLREKGELEAQLGRETREQRALG